MKGMIVCPQPQAAERGIAILRNGGNAVDAAVATAFLQMIASPTMCGIGGFGQMHVFMAHSGEETVIDFHAKAGSLVRPDMWKDIILDEAREGFGFSLRGGVNADGYTSIMVPGTVKGLFEGLTRYGTISWKEACRPAIDLASRGIIVTQEQAIRWRTNHDSFRKYLVTPEAGRIYTKQGQPYDMGEVIVNKDSAQSLRLLASGGPDVFYRGEIATKIIQDMETHGGFITSQDLERYEPTIYTPLTTEYRGFTVASNAAPGGGITLLELLNIIEGYNIDHYNWRGMGSDVSEYIHLLAMTMRAAQVDRSQYIGDPSFTDVPTATLLSRDRATYWRERIDNGEQIIVPKWPMEAPSTTHVSVVDCHGNAVSLTHTLGASSGVITPGLGFMYNNAMINFDPVPGHPNSIAPGKSRLTQMSPTIVLKDGRPYLVLGAPGGGKINSALFQTIIHMIDFDMPVFEAVAHPRIFCLHTDIIDVDARIPEYVCQQLEARGNMIVKTPGSYTAMALVQAIHVDSETDRVYGGADPRGGGIFLST
jgi:gamma-glutamyltranspeptidase/glutathione hydrolase